MALEQSFLWVYKHSHKWPTQWTTHWRYLITDFCFAAWHAYTDYAHNGIDIAHYKAFYEYTESSWGDDRLSSILSWRQALRSPASTMHHAPSILRSLLALCWGSQPSIMDLDSAFDAVSKTSILRQALRSPTSIHVLNNLYTWLYGHIWGSYEPHGLSTQATHILVHEW